MGRSEDNITVYAGATSIPDDDISHSCAGKHAEGLGDSDFRLDTTDSIPEVEQGDSGNDKEPEGGCPRTAGGSLASQSSVCWAYPAHSAPWLITSPALP